MRSDCFALKAVSSPRNGSESEQGLAVLSTYWRHCWRAASRITLAAKQHHPKHFCHPTVTEEGARGELCSTTSHPPQLPELSSLPCGDYRCAGEPAPSQPYMQSDPSCPSFEVTQPAAQGPHGTAQLTVCCLFFRHRDQRTLRGHKRDPRARNRAQEGVLTHGEEQRQDSCSRPCPLSQR